MVSLNKATYLYIYLLVTFNLKRIIVLIIIVMYIETEFYCELESKLLTVFQSSFFLLIPLFPFSHLCQPTDDQKNCFPLVQISSLLTKSI